MLLTLAGGTGVSPVNQGRDAPATPPGLPVSGQQWHGGRQSLPPEKKTRFWTRRAFAYHGMAIIDPVARVSPCFDIALKKAEAELQRGN